MLQTWMAMSRMGMWMGRRWWSWPVEAGKVPAWSGDCAASRSMQQLELPGSSLENIQHGRYLENNMKHLKRPIPLLSCILTSVEI